MIDSPSKGCFFESNSPSPLRDAHSFASELNKFYIRFVVGLDLRIRPATIARFIVAIIVDAINGSSPGRTWTHISQEIIERVQPPIAYSNAAPTVARIIRVALAVASILDRAPRPVLRRLRSILCCAVLGAPAPLVHVKAAAGIGLTSAKNGVPHENLAATIAPAPCLCVPVFLNVLYDGQPAEFSANFDMFSHSRNIPRGEA